MKNAGLLRWILFGLILIATAAAVAVFFLRRSIAAPATPTAAALPQLDQTQLIEQAIRDAMQAASQKDPVYALLANQIDDLRISADGNWATAWLTPLDPETGEPVPTEPGMVIVQRSLTGWKATLPADPGWTDVLQQVPEDLVPADKKEAAQQEAEVQALALAPAAPLSGYKLPFPGGDTRRLTQSVGHDRYTPSGNAHFSFDFATAYPSAMFQVVAARSGVVSRVRWTQANGSTAEPGNYIVLEDTSTIPITYQLYLHLAQDSIPAELRVIGAPVQRGQYLGMADDTGVSSGHHLHFMVHTQPTSYWGRSVDITFEDVPINGGRPRITSDMSYCKSSDVCSSTQADYLSTNYLKPDPVPPVGNITTPQTGFIVTAPTMQLQGWAVDDSSGMFSTRYMADFNGSWQAISDSISGSTPSATWNLCADQVPNGPVSLAMELRDKAFNQAPGLPGLTHFIKNYSCPVITLCTPGSNQAALFSEPNYGGQCTLVDANSSANIAGGVGDDNVASVKVGTSAKVTLFMDLNRQGPAVTLNADNPNLINTRVPPKTASSVLAQSRSTTPSIPAPVWPPNGQQWPTNIPLPLGWENSGGAVTFRVEIKQGNTTVQAATVSNDVVYRAAGLAPGQYTWQVRAESTGGAASAYSETRSLTITAATALPGCSDTDNQPSQASSLAYGGTADGAICPTGDVDFYKFTGRIGDVIGAWTEAQSLGSPLDTQLELYDSTGANLLARNDDMLRFERTDSWLVYKLTKDGDYYLKVFSWELPPGGGTNFAYRLNLRNDKNAPAAIFTSPGDNSRLTVDDPRLTVIAEDTGSGISHVVFQAHTSDWLGGGWYTLGEDWDPADGWSYALPTEQLSRLFFGAVFANIYDFAGNWTGVAVWQVTPPGIFLPYVVR